MIDDAEIKSVHIAKADDMPADIQEGVEASIELCEWLLSAFDQLEAPVPIALNATANVLVHLLMHRNDPQLAAKHTCKAIQEAIDANCRGSRTQ
jgi:hypothetical protein